MLLIIALTGFEFCFNYAPGVFFLVGPLSFVLFIIRRRELNVKVLIFFIVLLIWCIFQIITGQSEKSAVMNFYLRFIIYMFAAFSINDFERIFVKIIYVFACISIPMWIISNYVPGGYRLLTSTFPQISIGGLGLDPELSANPGISIGFYYVSTGSRNSGPFWEPGMFAVFLNIAYVFQLLMTRRPFDKISIVLLLALFSTFSTTGYIAGFVILTWYFIFMDFKPRSLLLLPAIGFGISIFLSSDFGLEKINDIAGRKETDSRFSAILYHISLLRDCWLQGRGFNSGGHELLMSPNGMSLVFLFWGIPFAIYYYGLLITTSIKIAKELAPKYYVKGLLIVLLTLLIVIFSQDVSTRHFYYFLIMYGFTPVYKYNCLTKSINSYSFADYSK